MSELSEHDLLKSQRIIDSLDIDEIRKNSMSVEEWIEHNDKLRESYNKEREVSLNANYS